MRIVLLLLTHLAALAIGFGAGIYFLPILTAPPAPTEAEVAEVARQAMFTGQFRRDLADSDRLHWGEGVISVSPAAISLRGEVSPGPDYMLYLSPEFIETEADFERLKPTMARVGAVKTFRSFLVEVPADIDPTDYTTVIVWCESFGEFITAARYQ